MAMIGDWLWKMQMVLMMCFGDADNLWNLIMIIMENDDVWIVNMVLMIIIVMENDDVWTNEYGFDDDESRRSWC